MTPHFFKSWGIKALFLRGEIFDIRKLLKKLYENHINLERVGGNSFAYRKSNSSHVTLPGWYYLRESNT